MTKAIQTHPQASITTFVETTSGTRRKAVVTSKQYIFNRVKDFHWHSVGEFTRRISRDGLRGRLSEMAAAGYQFNRRYDKNGRLTHIQLKAVPGLGFTTTTPDQND